MSTEGPSLVEKLTKFVERWHDYQSTEMAGAQSYCNSLLDCYGFEYEPGTIFEQHPIKVLEDEEQKDLFDNNHVKMKIERIDMWLPKICVWEMKGPKEDLDKHHKQILRYWSYTRTRYMVLCNFHEIRIWDTDRENGQIIPEHIIRLEDLPAIPGVLNFLRGDEIFYEKKSENITKEVAQHIGRSVRELIIESDNPQRDRERITKFALECVFAMFGEDTNLIPPMLFQQAIERAHSTGDLSPVYSLFDDFGREHEYDRSNALAPYINGPLFDRNHPKLAVNKSILARIYEASKSFNWTYVRPEVFGSIFEQAFLPHERHELGAHFTSEEDIMKVVGPTVVRPWRERIAACKSFKDCEALIERMKHYHVLDPACGSGNFLYVVYREMKLLELDLRRKHQELYLHKVSKNKKDMIPPPKGPYFTVQQLHGIDKDELAVQLSRVVIWIGQHKSSLETAEEENVLPLLNLSDNIVKADALFTDWFRPPDDGVSELAIVGNPPFLGGKRMRLELGDDYVDRLHAKFPDNRMADLVTYWYPIAINTLREGERAGFVSTNSIAQNESREASLDKIIAAGGTLVNCWKSYAWTGEAAVHVSIVNWINKTIEGPYYLDGKLVSSISPTFRVGINTSVANKINSNAKISFQGVVPANEEFFLTLEQKNTLIAEDEASAKVIKPFFVAADLNRRVDQSPSRYIIDFNDMEAAEAQKFQSAFKYVLEVVKPVKLASRQTAREKKLYWQFKRPGVDLRKAMSGKEFVLVTARVAPNLIYTWMETSILPDNALIITTLGSHFDYGILQSAIHETWAWARGSTLEERLRYTNTTIFETFPFPLTDCTDPFADGKEPSKAELLKKYDPRAVPDTDAARQLAAVAEELYEKRQAACKSLNLGLTKLYNFIKGKQKLTDLRADQQEIVRELQELHVQLNRAACRCYGWPEDTWQDENEVLSRLLRLNLALTGEG